MNLFVAWCGHSQMGRGRGGGQHIRNETNQNTGRDKNSVKRISSISFQRLRRGIPKHVSRHIIMIFPPKIVETNPKALIEILSVHTRTPRRLHVQPPVVENTQKAKIARGYVLFACFAPFFFPRFSIKTLGNSS